MKSFTRIKWLLLFLVTPTLMYAQKTERQIGDTTYYKTLIPATKQSLLKNVSMIANMNFAFRNEVNIRSRDLEMSSLDLSSVVRYMKKFTSAFAIGIRGHKLPSQLIT
jgi:hypothetical protein